MYVIVVESALDAILLGQEVKGDVIPVAVGSAQAMPDPDTDRLIRNADTALVALDSDEAGARAAWGNWRKRYPNARRLPVPARYGKDIGEAYRNGMPLDTFVRVGLKRAGVTLKSGNQAEADSPRVPESTVHGEANKKSKASNPRTTTAQKSTKNERDSRPATVETSANTDIPYEYIRTSKAAARAVERLVGAGERIGIDIETAALEDDTRAALDPHRSRPRLLQAYVEGKVQVFDLNKVPLDTVAPLLAQPWCAHNAVFDYKHLQHHGIKPTTPTCTMLLGNALDGRLSSLAEACHDHLGVELDKSAQVSDWSEAELSEEQLRYAARDAVMVRLLWEKLRNHVHRRGFERLTKVMLAAQPAIAQMELRGLGFDAESHGALVTTWRENLAAALGRIRLEAGQDFNPGSPKAVEAFFKDRLTAKQLDAWPRTAKGALSTAADAIAGFRGTPAVDLLLDHRMWRDNLSRFGEALAAEVHPVTGRLHAHFRIAGARTGRMSTNNPNVHGFPHAPDFRKLFVSSPGNVLVRADYNQMQLRIAALLSGDARLLGAYERGEDVHRLTAASVLGKKPGEVTREERALAKAIGFGILFGMGAAGLTRYAMSSYGVALGHSEAERVRQRFFETYPDVRRWQMERVDEAEATGSVTTPLGRARNFVRENKTETYTAAMNTPIQGAEAEVMLAALGHLPMALAQHNAFLVNCVHDELLVECPAHEVEAVKECVRTAMVTGMLDVFPKATLVNLVEVGSGPTWGDAK